MCNFVTINKIDILHSFLHSLTQFFTNSPLRYHYATKNTIAQHKYTIAQR